MTDEDVIRLNYEHDVSLFPKTCNACGRVFPTLRDYVIVTQRLGATISYDAEREDWQTSKPLGAAALANCPCGSTMSLTTKGLPLARIHEMLQWIKVETERRGLTSNQLLDSVRDEIRKRAMSDPPQGGTP